MQNKIKYPLLRKLLFIQVSLALFGALIIYAVFHLGSVALADNEFENEKQVVSIELNKVQDQWRAWAELGINAPLNEEIKLFERKWNLKLISLIKGVELVKGSYDLIIPDIQDNGLMKDRFYVVVNLKRKDFYQIVQTRKDVVLVVCCLMIFFWGIIYFSILYLQKNIHSPIIKLIENMQKSLGSDEPKDKDIQASGEMKFFVDQISSLQKKTKDMERTATLGVLTAQVSHDLMSPIATLEMILKESFANKGPEQELLQACLERIKEISESLLLKNKVSQNKRLVLSVEKELKKNIDLKRLEPIAKDSVLTYYSSGNLEPMATNIVPTEFGRIISNLLNNAIESYGKSGGKVDVILSLNGDNYQITIKDYGCGMSDEVLSRIGSFGVTFGKKNGSGIGINHAKTTIEALGGSFSIKSRQGYGTEVCLVLPGKF